MRSTIFVFLFVFSLKGADGFIDIGGVNLQRVLHLDRVTGTNDHFGTLLFGGDGHLVKHDGNRTWLYCGAKEDKWVSFVREFNLDTLKSKPRRKVLSAYQNDRWASVHLAVKVAEDFIVLFYSTGKQVRAAVSKKPEGPFVTDPDFGIRPSQEWEKNCSLESDCGFVKISEDANELRIWKLYDTLGKGSSGQNGWAEVRLDKKTRKVELVRKHPANPIKLLRPDFVAARTGGNIDSQIRFNGQYPLFYLSKKNSNSYRLAVALGKDPLFQSISHNREIAGPLGEEAVIEKFQFYQHADHLFLIYENSNRHNDWRTSIRKYKVISGSLR
ncbi:MAG: hypothetical protein P8M70_04375 [Verrucomicrobiota bacterium]|nr:hypothetical protein [Verrucomicrobiota bacterium]